MDDAKVQALSVSRESRENERPGSINRRTATTDEELLAAMGHKQELRRVFSVWSLASLVLCGMATWESMGAVVAQALLSGGAPCLFYNYIITCLGSCAIVFSLGEIASIYPTAGGQYHWVAALAPYKRRLAPSWFTGWICIGGQIVLCSSAAFAAGLQYQSLVTLNNLDTYIPQRWQGMLFYWAVLLYSGLINIFGMKALPHTNTLSAVLHVGGFIGVTVTLLALAPKHDAHYVFVETVNSTGWPNDRLAFLIGLISTIYAFLGYDAACHLSEELPSPSKNVPLAMIGSVLANGVIGFVYVIVLLFCLGDLESLLTSPTGFPIIQIYYNTTHSYGGTTIMTLIICLVATVANSAGLASCSRTFWAFARDDAIPASKFFSHVQPKLQVPVRMVLLVSLLEALLGLLYLGSTTAFNAILSMSILGMYVSYLLPILYMLLYGRARTRVFGPFRLGRRLGPVVNVLAILWLVFGSFWSTWPNFYPVTAVNMNYSTVVLGGWVLFGGIYFTFWGKYKYNGPLVETEVVSENMPKV